MDVIEKELTIKGFIVTSYKPKFVEGIKELSQWIEEVRKQFSYSFLHPIQVMIKKKSLILPLEKKFMITQFRSSQQMCSLKKGVLRNFVKFTGKHLHQSLFFNRVAGLRPATLLKKRPWRRCFPVNFTKFLRIPFSQNTSGRLLLIVVFNILSNVHDEDFLRKYSHHTCLKGS